MHPELISTDVDVAVDRLRAGGLVALPTETVYGLAADATQAAAVERIFEVKGRPSNHPLIVHAASYAHTEGWVGPLAPATASHVTTLAAACWPGPLTMLVPRGPKVLDVVTGGRATVGIRIPSHPLTTAVLERLDRGVAAPSANRFGRVSPTSAAHVVHDLHDRLNPVRDVVLDGGACPIGVESTIVDMTVTPPQVLRAGAIGADDIARLLAAPVAGAAGPSRASGMLTAHYAPSCEVVLAATRTEADDQARRRAGRGLRVEVLDRSADLVVAARELYADLRGADVAGLDAIVVVMPPPVGIGHAIRDRLTKAAAGWDPARSSRAR